MSRRSLILALCLVAAVSHAEERPPIVNPNIDMKGYLGVASDAAKHRESRRLTEAEFIKMSREPGTVILDARSRERFDELHIKGALHLSFPDIAVESLERLLPNKNARILIYCNNNFLNEPTAFPTKIMTASLNLHTFTVLTSYGYTNVYELGPLIDIDNTRIEFEGTRLHDR